MDMKSDDCAWFRREHEIEVREDVSFSAFSSEGEVVIMLSAGENDLDLKTEEAAFLFGGNQDDLWFMPRMGSFYKVSLNPDEEPVATKLSDLLLICLLFCSGCASSPCNAGQIISGILLGTGTGLSGL